MQSPRVKATGRAEGRSTVLSRRNFIALAGLAVTGATAGALIWRFQPAPDHDQPRLSVAEAFASAGSGQITLVDIRTPREWRSTGVPVGSIQIDMRRDDFTEALSVALQGDRSAPVALICARGVRSARMVRQLAEAGFSQIIDVPEGMLGSRAGPGWIAGNLPVARWQG
ncbi:rhodanese-like domain-containing protein [Phaeobacter sp. PT47_59]|uniref:rhodanese-like domain-containing protein n=1 Tax=Phaeobacter sp. PT47_59 TaxID=3029979 RepID=UPI0023808688|nr:rhodanese-like domain-containing protein [Phaeobacter sp. PT47_59]MDE4172838.1 rhodanese-like domain-containing protein [Phaeobacter sp. PT47_59]